MDAGISAADKGGRPAPVDAHRSLRAESGAVRGELPGRSKSPLVKDAGLAWLEFEKPDLVRAERFFHDLDRHTGNDIDLATLRSLLRRCRGRQARNPRYLHDGDVVTATIATPDRDLDLGTLRNTVRRASS